jgi:hypothetical protein
VELLVSMLILATVCIAWLQIIGIQSARREARRREAVERLSGMMDAFMYHYRTGRNDLTGASVQNGFYRMELDSSTSSLDFSLADRKIANPMFDAGVSPIGYQLAVVKKSELERNGKSSYWNETMGRGTAGVPRWLVGKLYDESGDISDGVSKPFFTLQVCLGL